MMWLVKFPFRVPVSTIDPSPVSFSIVVVLHNKDNLKLVLLSFVFDVTTYSLLCFATVIYSRKGHCSFTGIVHMYILMTNLKTLTVW